MKAVGGIILGARWDTFSVKHISSLSYEKINFTSAWKLLG
jgi:hypothetical protein